MPRNVTKWWIYWNRSYPAGIADIPKDDWIDYDEAGILVETASRKSGKTYIGVRVREEGPYNDSEKYTLTLAISGDAAGERWIDFERKAGTTVEDCHDFIFGRALDQVLHRGDGYSLWIICLRIRTEL